MGGELISEVVVAVDDSEPVDIGRLVAPFPYYGGKRRHVAKIWKALGDPQAYVEPFGGSAAVLLGRPPSALPRRRELLNDSNGWVTNFWRAVKANPGGVAEAAGWPVNELDLAARQSWFETPIADRLRAEPEWFDSKLAGVWAWGMSACIGGVYPGGGRNTLPFCLNYRGVTQRHVDLAEWCEHLAVRLRHVQVVCGDWKRPLSPALWQGGGHESAVFLDPPYGLTAGGVAGDQSVYESYDVSVAEQVQLWAVDNASDRLRVVLCGFEGEHDMPDGWVWEPLGTVGKTKSAVEGMWLSAACASPLRLFG